MTGGLYGSGFPKSLDDYRGRRRGTGAEATCSPPGLGRRASPAPDRRGDRHEHWSLHRSKNDRRANTWRRAAICSATPAWVATRGRHLQRGEPTENGRARGDRQRSEKRRCKAVASMRAGRRISAFAGSSTTMDTAPPPKPPKTGTAGAPPKPALKRLLFSSKPYTDEQVRDIIQSNLFDWRPVYGLLSSANAAEKNSTSNQSEYGAACAIAQWNADEITSTQADLCGQMGTSLFALATTTSLSIVSSWRRTLAESWSDGEHVHHRNEIKHDNRL